MANPLLILTAIGPQDKPGIIAALTGAVLDSKGNLDDATMTRLHGAFATMIAARVAEPEITGLRARLDAIADSRGLHIVLEIIPEGAENDPATAGPDHIVTVYGADHPGIVYHVARLLSEHGANITDLDTRLIASGPAQPIYVMMVETSGGDWETLPTALKLFGQSESADVSFSAIEEETL